MGWHATTCRQLSHLKLAGGEMLTTEELLDVYQVSDTYSLMKTLGVYRDGSEFIYARTKYKNMEDALNQSHHEKTGGNDAFESLEERLNSILLTTAPSVDGYNIVNTIDIISYECAMGMSIFSDIFTSASDIIGGRSGKLQETLLKAKEICLKGIRKQALNLKSNAVIGVGLNYSEFSGKGKSMLFVVATGTAVQIEKQ